ncbi:hypothetical protein DVA86_29075 [Streptomyces armeniacus]|uniref:AAA+ ATPase domain-containing protein n=2 Tax=Streptomyces armeniacus TaxID=83291 RepID=A0A345XWP0_9ACTN|nr:hypothetical protein DVA86_29075 [Streptomyces armeniacus]
MKAAFGGTAAGGDIKWSATAPNSTVIYMKNPVIKIGGSDAAAPSAPSHEPTSPRTAALPPAPAGFTGREDELADVLAQLNPGPEGAAPEPGRSERSATSGSPGPPTTTATTVTGMPGVGKTALAQQAAQEAVRQRRFPGGAFFVDLRGDGGDGAGGGGAPLTTEEAVRQLLSAAGESPDGIPPDGQVAAWQRFLARLAEEGSPVLVVLDNAASAGTVSPLLHGGPHRFLVTSRQTLSALTAHRVVLGPMPHDDALAMLDSRLRHIDAADGRVTGDAVGADRLVELCDHLPLALRVAAAALGDEPARSPAQLADALGAEGARSDALAYDDTDESGRPLAVTAAFGTSYRRLSGAQARVFRLLPLATGADVSTSAAAALAGLTVREVRPLLAALARNALLQPHGADRWSMHGLVRSYSAALPRSEEEREDAAGRFLTHLVDTAGQALSVLAADGEHDGESHGEPGGGTGDGDSGNGDGTRGDALRFDGPEEAAAWLRSEHDTLLSAVPAAAEQGQPGLARRLFGMLSACQGLLPSSQRWVEVARGAVERARTDTDREGEAAALRVLGTALVNTGREDEGIAALESSLRVSRESGDRGETLAALLALAGALVAARRPGDARPAAETAREAAREQGEREAEAEAQFLLGHVHILREDRTEAAVHLLDAAAAARECRDPYAEGRALGMLGHLRCDERSFAEAAVLFRETVAAYRAAAEPHAIAPALRWLACALIAAPSEAEPGEVVATLTEATDLHHGTGDRADEVRALRILALQLAVEERRDDAYEAADRALDVHRALGAPAQEADLLFRLALLRMRYTDMADSVREGVDRGHDALMHMAQDPYLRKAMKRHGKFEDYVRSYNTPRPAPADAPGSEQLQQFLRVLAGVGEPADKHFIGCLLATDPERVDAAARWWREAADDGHVPAHLLLGVTAAGRQDWEDAERHFRQAAESGDTEAMYHLGHTLQKRSAPERLAWWRAAADAGHNGARVSLALEHLQAQDGSREEVEDLLRPAADAGNDQAVRLLGTLLHQRGALGEAERLLRLSAAAGTPDGMASLGDLLSDTHRRGLAVWWWRRAAEAGHTGAMVSLGFHAVRARWTEHWWLTAAEAGDDYGMRLLAKLLSQQGRHREAERWQARASAAQVE